MLTLPDFKEKQIVFLNGDDISKIQLQNDNLIVRDLQNNIKNKISSLKIFSVFVVGDTTITTPLIRQLTDIGISLFLMKKNFEVYAIIGAETQGNVLLRTKQYNIIDTLPISKKLIENKVSNQLDLIKEIREKNVDHINAIRQIKSMIEKLKTINDEKELLGIEGNVSKIFFQSYFKKMGWKNRMPRTKCDYINTLLDIGYTYLFNIIDAILMLYGFDTYKGIYHKEFYMRKSLSCDIMEPFRCIIDKQILKSYNLGQINEKEDFKLINEEYHLEYKKSFKYTKIFFEAILEHKEEIYLYIQSFYRYILDEKRDFPFFYIINKNKNDTTNV